MKKILLVLFLACISFVLPAQNPNKVMDAASSPVNMGSILSEVGNGLKPEAFSSAFKPSKWLGSLSSLKADDIAGTSKMLGELAGGLKPESLLKGFNLKDWQSKLKSATSISALSTQAESLIKNINPSAFKNGFDVSTVLSSLDMLKGMK